MLPVLKASVTTWREMVPVVASLRNPDFRERHWAKVDGVLGKHIERNAEFTLESMFTLKVS